MTEAEKKHADNVMEYSIAARGAFLAKIAKKMQEVAQIADDVFKNISIGAIPIFQGATEHFGGDDSLVEWFKQAQEDAAWMQARADVYMTEYFDSQNADGLRECMKKQLENLKAGEEAIEKAAGTGAFGEAGDDSEALMSIRAAKGETEVILEILDGKTGTDYLYLDDETGRVEWGFGNVETDDDDADDA